MKAMKLAILAITMFPAGITAVKAQTADEIIDKNIKAMGGVESWNKISTMKMIGSMSMQGFEISMTKTVADGKAMRMDISAAGMSGFHVVTKDGGWSYMPMMTGDKVVPIPADQLKMEQAELSIKNNRFLDRSKISKVEYQGRDTINSVPCFKLKVTDKEGKEQIDLFDAATYYLVRVETTVTIKGEDQELALNFGNYQKQPEGIVIPMSMSIPGAMGDIMVKSVEINKPVPDDFFKPVAPKD